MKLPTNILHFQIDLSQHLVQPERSMPPHDISNFVSEVFEFPGRLAKDDRRGSRITSRASSRHPPTGQPKEPAEPPSTFSPTASRPVE